MRSSFRSTTLPLLLLPMLCLAQSSGGAYVMRKQVVAGGAQSSAGSYRLVGTTSQALAAVSTGASYRLTSGFHGPRPATPVGTAIFANGFE